MAKKYLNILNIFWSTFKTQVKLNESYSNSYFSREYIVYIRIKYDKKLVISPITYYKQSQLKPSTFARLISKRHIYMINFQSSLEILYHYCMYSNCYRNIFCYTTQNLLFTLSLKIQVLIIYNAHLINKSTAVISTHYKKVFCN